MLERTAESSDLVQEDGMFQVNLVVAFPGDLSHEVDAVNLTRGRPLLSFSYIVAGVVPTSASREMFLR